MKRLPRKLKKALAKVSVAYEAPDISYDAEAIASFAMLNVSIVTARRKSKWIWRARRLAHKEAEASWRRMQSVWERNRNWFVSTADPQYRFMMRAAAAIDSKPKHIPPEIP